MVVVLLMTSYFSHYFSIHRQGHLADSINYMKAMLITLQRKTLVEARYLSYQNNIQSLVASYRPSDHDLLRRSMRRSLQETGADHALITDANGNLLTHSPNYIKPNVKVGESLLYSQAIKRALKGLPAMSIEPDRDTLAIISSVPIFLPDSDYRVIGTVSIEFFLNREYVTQIKSQLGLDIALVFSQNQITSTLRTDDNAQLLKYLSQQDIQNTNGGAVQNPFFGQIELPSGGFQSVSSIIFGQDNDKASAKLVLLEDESVFYTQMFRFLAGLLVAGIVIFMGIAWMAYAIAGKLTVPLKQVSLALTELSHGKYPKIREADDTLETLALSRAAAELSHTLQANSEEIASHQLELMESEGNLRALAENANDGILVAVEGKHVFANPEAARMLGYTIDELLQTAMSDLIHPDEFEKVNKRHQKRLKGEKVPKHYQTIFVRQDGRSLPVELTAATTIWRGKEAGLIFVRDITERKRTEEILHEEKERAEVTLGSIGDAVIRTDTKGIVNYLNPVAEGLTGWKNDSAQGKPLSEVFNIIHEDTGKTVENPVNRCLRQDRIIVLADHTALIRQDGVQFSIEDSAAPIRDLQGNIIGAVLVFHDVTEVRKLTNKMQHQATHDSLTGLINRQYFETILDRALASATNEGKKHALCYLDLDQFKVVNDTCGHVAGDSLLQQLALQLQDQVRERDVLGRLGGDEFGILLEDCPLEKAEVIAEKLRNVIKEFRFSWQDKVFEIGVSIGMVPITEFSGTLTDVLSAADSACYVAKDLGRNRVHVFQADDIELVKRQGEMQWMQSIQRALAEDRFQLYIQSIVPLSKRANKERHAELLVRMLDEDGNIIMPGAFMPAAERYHLMLDLDRWVVKNAIKALKDGNKKMAGLTSISINLSGQSISNDDFLKYIVKLIKDFEINPKLICFEITETAVISNMLHATRLISTLNEMGCRFSLDDFGSGLSSFAYLKNLMVDYLKIDGSFVKHMLDDKTDFSMVAAINQIGQTMGVRTIAESVENNDIKKALKKMGVDFAQGFGISLPETLDEKVH